MDKLTSLKVSAAKSAILDREHILGDWKDSVDGTASTCKCACGVWVTVNTKPLPNDIEIGGSALAINCTIGDKDAAWAAAYEETI